MGHAIVEGPDGAGKTYLAKKICERYGHDYHHEGPPPADRSALHHYASVLMKATEPTVFDRFHLGELVYGPLLRGKSGLAPAELTLMNRLLMGTGTSVVVCLPPWDITLANTHGRQELITKEVTLEAAYDGWKTLIATQRIPNVQFYDYTFDDAFSLKPTERLPVGAIGDPRATVLFVGEQPNSVELDLPFFGTSRSSGYLNARLLEAGFTHGFALTNALQLNGKPRDLRAIINGMRPKLRVCVALGKVAAQALEDADAPKTIALPHPQFWKRFHAKDTLEYARLLTRVRSFA